MSENSDLPTPEEIVEIHAEIEREYDFKYTGARVVAPELKLKRLLDDVDEYSGVYHRAAALLRKILTAHYFEDGNKRTAWTVTVLYLEEHDHEPAERGREPLATTARCDRRQARRRREIVERDQKVKKV